MIFYLRDIYRKKHWKGLRKVCTILSGRLQGCMERLCRNLRKNTVICIWERKICSARPRMSHGKTGIVILEE